MPDEIVMEMVGKEVNQMGDRVSCCGRQNKRPHFRC